MAQEINEYKAINNQVFHFDYLDNSGVYRAEHTTGSGGNIYTNLIYYINSKDSIYSSYHGYNIGFSGGYPYLLGVTGNVGDNMVVRLTNASSGTNQGTTGHFYAKDLKDYTFVNGIQRYYTFSFDANGGQGAPADQTKEWGVTITLPDKTHIPSRTGYTFVCWRDGDNKDFNPGDECTYNYNCTFYAVWQANTYTVVYDGNGGTWNGQTTWSDTATYNSDYPIQSNFFTRTGYTFLGWSETSNAVDSSWQNWQGHKWKWTSTKDTTTLYALWMPNPSNIKLLKSGTDIEINKLRYRDDIDIGCSNSNSLPTFTVGENGQESGTRFYIEDSYGHEVKNINAAFGEDNVHVGKMSDISDIEAASTIRIFVQNFVTLWGNNEDRTYISDSGRSYYVNNSGILRIQTGNTNNSWKEGQVYIKTNNGWKEASSVYVKTDAGWKEST